mmetsp:Transcript_11577/g.18540  ORF Transcript_11577/g.18540 Transcript_11577/m.18540 type:complete len:475 (-) Transcript_11577:35-1459(-)|eukprot:CAMPEP_0194574638 /NCGR_PEP_ID=MMETSP0292-20121207/10412_1 /TAXON_ID=39354 /ORGANISM="Heterosigma akashiwo, Strain CCMP2393" /LENGTH=474 /DNA_ID=CAMNT_0039426205 /DNA_START=74 /DNA_END=1498 /DNA_ORIENTATION=+
MAEDKGSNNRIQADKVLLGLGYLLGTFVSGVLVLGMEINLEQLAENCDVSLAKATSALIFRSGGAIFGSLFAGKLLNLVEPHSVLISSVFAAAMIMEGCNYATNIWFIYLFFTLMGCLVGFIQVSALLLIRLLFKETAGPWLQSSALTFQLGCVTFPILKDTLSFHLMYHILAVLMALISLYIFSTKKAIIPKLQSPSLRTPGGDAEVQEGSSMGGEGEKSFGRGDVISAFCLFFLGGLIVETTTYLESYIEDVGASVDSDDALVALTSTSLLAQMITLYLQQDASTGSMVTYFISCAAAGLVCQLPPLIWSASSTTALWVTIFGTGLFFGPCWGLVFDVWDRFTAEPTAWGSALLNLGLQGGCGFYASGAYWVWSQRGWPRVLLCSNALAFAAAAACTLALLTVPPGSRKAVAATAAAAARRPSLLGELVLPPAPAGSAKAPARQHHNKKWGSNSVMGEALLGPVVLSRGGTS